MARKPPRVYEARLDELSEDDRNANKGTGRGREQIGKSVRDLGAARSIVVDAHGQVVAGNKSRAAMLEAGMRDAIVVETDGTRPIVVKRTDWDLREQDGDARRYAYADNRSGQVSLEWDVDRLRTDLGDGFDLGDVGFEEIEVDRLLAAGVEIDPTKEWRGMPEYEQPDQMPEHRLIVNFKSKEDLLAFAKLVAQSITEQTRSIWFPAAERGSIVDKRYTSDK